MKYYTTNDVKVIECEPSEFHVVYVNKAKKNITTASTYVNANFFAAGQKCNGETFTLPVNHLICDYEVTSVGCDTMNKMRGKFINGKYYYDSFNYGCTGDQFYQKPLTTFIIDKGKPRIEDVKTLNTSWEYAVAGIPIMKNGADVKWSTYVKPQGWLGGELYSTYHIFLGLKSGSNTIYIVNYKTSGTNCIYNGTAYKKFKSLGFTDVIKLDGGGSCIMKYQGSIKQATSENRQINAIIKISGSETKTTTSTATSTTTVNKTPVNSVTNPYVKPTRSITRYMTGNDVKWVQFQLNKSGNNCGAIDGSFGNGCYIATKNFQKAKGLEMDGSVGPITRKALENI